MVLPLAQLHTSTLVLIMASASNQIVQKLWNYCNVLPACAEQRAAGRRDDLSACDAQAGGMSYGG